MTVVDNSSNEPSQLEDRNTALNTRTVMQRNLIVAEAVDNAMKRNGGKFEIRLRIPTGNTSTNILGSEEIEFEEGKFETKTFRFRPISTNEWNQLLRVRAELNNEMVKPLGEADNVKINDMTTRIYEFLALKFLGIKHDDYIRAEWEDVKLAIDACSFVYESGVRDFDINQKEEEEEQYELPLPVRENKLKLVNPMDPETIRLNKRTIDVSRRNTEINKQERGIDKKPENSSPKKYYDYEG